MYYEQASYSTDSMKHVHYSQVSTTFVFTCKGGQGLRTGNNLIQKHYLIQFLKREVCFCMKTNIQIYPTISFFWKIFPDFSNNQTAFRAHKLTAYTGYISNKTGVCDLTQIWFWASPFGMIRLQGLEVNKVHIVGICPFCCQQFKIT